MDGNARVRRAKRVGTGLSLIVMPLVFVFAFANHPGLLNPHLMSPEGLILRAHNASLLQFGHVLVTLATALLVVVAVYFMKLLDRTSWAWAGLVGGAVAILGAVILAADKGALCLTMTALDTLPADEFARMMPGLLAMFSFKGWMPLLWGMALLPLGFGIQAVALIKTRVIPRWQGVLFLIGALFIGFPDGAEIINLTAAILMAVSLVPCGIRLLSGRGSEGNPAIADAETQGIREARFEGSAEQRSSSAPACAGCRRRSVAAGCTRA
ncbi:MAG: hypothetical protein CVT59_05560 [Actinobacteria bacterium HGW-Actinobacteria-1]|nr:MAG: hypothetical protein CVT59_05560 [Actinobacteria bacterium HGW-Actinobacteria-1]